VNAQAVALGLTLAVECTGMALAMLAIRKDAATVLWAVALTAGLNLVSHTIFSMALTVMPWSAEANLLLAEVAVALAESIVYRLALRLSWGWALALGFGLNALSYFVAIWLWSGWAMIGGW
jgi:hypothetical protein